MKWSEKNDNEEKNSKRKIIKWNSGTICKETIKKILRSVIQFVKSIPSEVKRSEKNVYFVSLRSETKQKNLFFVSLRSETKKSEAKWSKTTNFRKQNKAKIRCICFALGWKRKIRSEKKQNEAKKKLFLFAWACETHAKRISFRFVSLWSEKMFEAKPAHPTPRVRVLLHL